MSDRNNYNAFSNICDVLEDKRDWSIRTFGGLDEIGPLGPIRHMAKEVAELEAAPHDIMEYVDVLFLLDDALIRAGFDWATLASKAYDKLGILEQRHYPKTPDGVSSEHVR
jgi:Protein of unknown function (DUF550)